MHQGKGKGCLERSNKADFNVITDRKWSLLSQRLFLDCDPGLLRRASLVSSEMISDLSPQGWAIIQPEGPLGVLDLDEGPAGWCGKLTPQ